MYQPYLSIEDFKEYDPNTNIEDEKLKRRIEQASRHIDLLTFNRIVGSMDNLTSYQEDNIKYVTSRLVEFEYENEDLISSILASYSINGVSMDFNKSYSVEVINGVVIPKTLYSLLCQTGLCTRSFYY